MNRKKILFIEDDEGIARLVKRRLGRTKDFECDLAHNGTDGIAKVKDANYDLLLLDFDLPDLTGFDVFGEIKALGIKVPCIMVTANGNESVAVSALKAGFSDYLVKDTSSDFIELLPVVVNQVIEQVISKAELARKHRETIELGDSLQLSNSRLRQLNEEKSMLLGMLAHELRNPIGAIQVFSDLILEDPSNSDVITYVKEIKNAADGSLDMLGELLNSVELDSAQIKLKKETFNLSALLSSMIPSYQSWASEKNITISSEITLGLYIFADKMKIREIIDNLISNAIKYSPRRKIIWIKCFQVKNLIWCSIKDQGPGFNEEDQKKIYGRFQRLSARPTANESSSGLGLSIVKTIMDLHEAEIELLSESGKGSEFRLYLPTSE